MNALVGSLLSRGLLARDWLGKGATTSWDDGALLCSSRLPVTPQSAKNETDDSDHGREGDRGDFAGDPRHGGAFPRMLSPPDHARTLKAFLVKAPTW